MRVNDIVNEFYDPANDHVVKYDYDDTRRPRLTLMKIRKLRMSRDTERVEQQDHLNFIPQMYGTPDDDGMM